MFLFFLKAKRKIELEKHREKVRSDWLADKKKRETERLSEGVDQLNPDIDGDLESTRRSLSQNSHEYPAVELNDRKSSDDGNDDDDDDAKQSNQSNEKDDDGLSDEPATNSGNREADTEREVPATEEHEEEIKVRERQASLSRSHSRRSNSSARGFGGVYQRRTSYSQSLTHEHDTEYVRKLSFVMGVELDSLQQPDGDGEGDELLADGTYDGDFGRENDSN